MATIEGRFRGLLLVLLTILEIAVVFVPAFLFGYYGVTFFLEKMHGG